MLNLKKKRGEYLKKSTKIIIIFFTVIGLVTGAAALGTAIHFSRDYSADIDASAYLCEKYNIKESELELKKYVPSKCYIDDSLFIEVAYSTPLWVYEYEGKEIHVSKQGVYLYDDLQLEEIEKMAVEYLRENFDENICGVSIFSDDIKWLSCTESPAPLTKDDIPALLKRTSYPIRIYIRSNDFETDLSKFSGKKLESKLNALLELDAQHDHNVILYLIDDTVELERNSRIYDSYHETFFSMYNVSFETEDSADETNEHIKIVP